MLIKTTRQRVDSLINRYHKKGMNITFLINGFVPPEDASKNVQAVFNLAMNEIQCPSEAISEVIVAEGERFGEAVKKLSSCSYYTNNSFYTAVGKTIKFPPESNVTGSGIVIRSEILHHAFKALETEFGNRTAEEKRDIYAVWHEVGHAKDNLNREWSPSSWNLEDPSGMFKIRYIAERYTDNVSAEIMACYFSAPACDQQVFDMENDSTSETISEILDDVNKSAIEYDHDVQNLRKIAFQAAQGFWTIMLQYAKLIALIIGNPHLERRLAVWNTSDDATKSLMVDYVSVVNDLIAGYPKPPESVKERIFEIWKKLALIHGYDFRESSTSGDGIYWNSLLINLKSHLNS
jgi:hypothetical protein